MAVILAGSFPIQMTGASFDGLAESEVQSSSSTAVTFYNEFEGETYAFGGSFGSFNEDGVPQSGTITSFVLRVGGQIAVTITGISFAVPSMLSFVESGDFTGFLDALLAGDDTITGSNADLEGPDDLLTGGAGNDILNGRGGQDTLLGGQGNDRMTGGAGDDDLSGGAGFDFFTASGDGIETDFGNDRYDGGSGVDEVNYAGAQSGIHLDLRQGTSTDGFGGIDTLVSIERVRGGAFDDVMYGSSTNDQLFGQAGDDLLVGGQGGDLLDGGSGSDTASYETAASGVEVDLQIFGYQNTQGGGQDNLSSIEHLIGSAHIDSLVGDILGNRLTGGAGSDTLVGMGGADVLDGGVGDDFLIGVNPDGSASGADRLEGGAGADFFVVDAGDRVKAFDADDAGLVFVTPWPAGNIEIVTTAAGTEIRAWNADLEGYESIWIETPVNPAELAVETYTSEGESGVILTRVPAPETRVEQVIIDLPTVRAELSSETASTLPTIMDTFTGEVTDHLIDYIADHDNFVGAMADAMKTSVTFKVAGAVVDLAGKYFDLADRFELGHAIGTYINDAFIDPLLWGRPGKFQFADGTENPAAHVDALLEIIVDQIPFGETLYALGGALVREVAVEIFGIVAAGMSEFGGDLQALLEAAAAGVARNTTSDGDDLQVKGDGETEYEGGAGDDTQLGAWTTGGLAAPPAAQAALAAEGVPEDDTFDGGDGVDTLVYSFANGAISVDLAAGLATGSGIGNDTILNIENVFAGQGNDTLAGTVDANRLNGDDGDDTLEGRGGGDTIDGGAGTDTAVFSGAAAGSTVSTVGGVTTVTGPDGTDTLTHVEHLQFSDGTLIVGAGGGQYFDGTSGADSFTGTRFNDQMIGRGGADSLSGGVGNDELIGGDGDDVLNGQAGVDAMTGGAGNDTYFVNNRDDMVVEGAGGGSDTVRAQSDYTLASGVEVEVLRAAAGSATFALNLFGNEFDNLVLGNAGINALRGMGGDDDLRGFAGDDVLTGGAGNDALDGGAGTDTAVFSGRRADYVVSLSAGVTTVTGADGTDTLVNVEQLQFIDGLYGPDGLPASRIDGTAGADTLQGTVQPDQIWGAAGDDALSGGVGDDLLYGQDGNDVLNGQAGVDQMTGGSGNDTYFVNNSSDVVVEDVGGGVDTVRAQGSYFLAAGVEVEVLRAAVGGATTALNLFGNEFDNLVLGNAGANVLRGNGGEDDLRGFAGDDVLRGGADDDSLDGGAGTDTAQFAGVRAGYSIVTVGGVTTVTGADGTDTLVNVERLQFSDGLYDVAGAPLAAPQVLPALGADKADPLVDDPFVLPDLGDGGPLVLPGLEALKGGDEPLVLPGAEDVTPLYLNLEARLALTGDGTMTLDPGVGLWHPTRPGHEDWLG